MVKDSSIIRKGAGKKGDPHLYSLSREVSDIDKKPDSNNSGFLVPTIDAEPEKGGRKPLF
jgi:hypothetical protein